MVFSSLIFLGYFLPLFLLGYQLVPYRWKNSFALLGSLFFYAWGAPRFIFVLLVSLSIDFWLAKKLVPGQASFRKRWLVLGLFLNLALLASFKYGPFLLEEVLTLATKLGMDAPHWTAWALPIGISFFTFQKISYLVDVYRGQEKPLDRWQDYALYIMLFPQLIAGPIIRFGEIAAQIRDRQQHIHAQGRAEGMFRFVIGLSKKLLIANPLGAEVDAIFAMESGLHSGLAWVGILAYAFQIYFDFSGYSDMAIGLGRMMGFIIPENFRYPYIASSITDFWRRWHLSLSRWMKDYLYIPLGGNQKGNRRTYLNLWIVFLLSGFWHGAAWTFLLWGAFHGFWLSVERWFRQATAIRWSRYLTIWPTFLISLLGWVIFRAESLTQITDYYWALFVPGSGQLFLGPYFWTLIAIASLISFLPLIPPLEKAFTRFWEDQASSGQFSLLKGATTLILLLACLLEVVSAGFNPFIYFRF
ncbi:MAG: MBOAT family O-acyltransferase [Bacteroidota bacterium]